MTIPLIINGAQFDYPTTGDSDWGDVTSAWAQAATDSLIPLNGGTFPLTGQLDFGNTAGLRVLNLTTASASPIPASGFMRMPFGTNITWRNFTNTGDLALSFNSVNQLTVNGTPVGGGGGSVPGAADQLLSADGSGGFTPVVFGASGRVLSSTGAGTTWIDPTLVPSVNGIDVVASLPLTSTEGKVVYNTADGLLYRYSGTIWTATIPAAEVSGQITNGQIQDSAITAVKIGDGEVTAVKTNLAAISPLSGLLNSNTVDTAQLVTNAVTSLKVLDGAITAAKTNVAAINATTGNLNSSTVNSAQLVANAVDAVAIAAGAVTASKTALAAIDSSSGNLTANSVTATNITAGAVVAGKIAANAVTATEIAANSITATKIDAGAVVAGKIAANAVTATEIAAGSISTVKLQAGAVTANELAANSVVAGKIAAAAVTATELAAGSVVAGKIAAGAVTTTELAAGAVTTSRLNVIVGGGNLAGNASFEALASGNRPSGYAEFNGAAISTTYIRPAGRAAGTFAYGLQANANTSSTFGITTNSSLEPLYGGVQNGWIAGQPYVISFYARKVNGAGWSDMGLSWTVSPTAGTATNPNLTTSFQRYVFPITWGGSVQSLGALSATVNGNTVAGDQLIIDDIQVEPGDLVTAWAPRTNELLPGSVVASQIAANTIVAANIAAGTITTSQIAANTITGGNIAAGTVTATNIAANTIVASNIATQTITTDRIQINAATANVQLSSGFVGITPPAATLDWGWGGDTASFRGPGITMTGGYLRINVLMRQFITYSGGSSAPGDVCQGQFTLTLAGYGNAPCPYIVYSPLYSNNTAFHGVTEWIVGPIANGTFVRPYVTGYNDSLVDYGTVTDVVADQLFLSWRVQEFKI